MRKRIFSKGWLGALKSHLSNGFDVASPPPAVLTPKHSYYPYSAEENNIKDMKFPFSLAELKVLDETIMKLDAVNPTALFGFFASLYVAYVSFRLLRLSIVLM